MSTADEVARLRTELDAERARRAFAEAKADAAHARCETLRKERDAATYLYRQTDQALLDARREIERLKADE